MYNFEKYNDIIQSIDVNFGINKHTKLPTACANMHCQDCIAGRSTRCIKIVVDWLLSEYIEPPVDWTKVEPDTPILVRIDYSGAWEKRHFAKYEFGQVHYWIAGKTSWTTNQTCWRLPDSVRLAE